MTPSGIWNVLAKEWQVIIVRFFFYNNQVSLNYPTYKCQKKKRFSSKNMKISQKKQILYVLSILNGSDEAWGWSWIYFAFIFSILEVWRAVILLLKTILWGLLFWSLVPCVATYRKTLRFAEIVTWLFLNEETRVNIACTMKADEITKQKRYDTYLFVSSCHYCC